MKKLLVVLVSLVVIVLIVFVFINSTYQKTFDTPYPSVELSTDSAVLAHGEYLLYGPAHCASCHVSMDQFEDVEAGEKVALTGGFTISFALGSFVTPNITMDPETGIGNMSDGEIARTLRYNVNSEGQAIIPFMPFTYMSEYDMNAIISYLRQQEGVKHENPKTTYTLLGKVIKRFMLKPAVHEQEIPAFVQPDTSIAYGEYLANNVANCYGCHTEFDPKKGTFIGEPFAGGAILNSEMVDGQAYVTPNITPDPTTGIMANWSQKTFVERIRAGRDYEDSPMPWGPFSRMTENDLKAVYAYLMSLKPVENKIEKVVITLD